MLIVQTAPNIHRKNEQPKKKKKEVLILLSSFPPCTPGFDSVPEYSAIDCTRGFHRFKLLTRIKCLCDERAVLPVLVEQK